MSRKSMSLVFDFDGTITSQDTIGVLADIGQRFQQQRDVTIFPSWSQIVEAYGQDYIEHAQSAQPAEELRRTLEEELRYLRSLRPVEIRSLRRVESSGLFGGMNESDFFDAGKEALQEGRVQLRDGFSEVLSAAKRNQWPVYVLSVNWSRSFIRGVLDGLFDGDIMANEAQKDGTISGPDILGAPSEDNVLATCEDKARGLQALAKHKGGSLGRVTYFGDSTSDIEGLTLDRGVCISSSADSKLVRTLARVGLSVPPVSDAGQSDTLVRAATFKEVLEMGFLQKQLE